MEEEFVTLSIQGEKAETYGDKVGMQISQEIVNLDSDDEKYAGGMSIQDLIKELSLLKLEARSGKINGPVGCPWM